MKRDSHAWFSSSVFRAIAAATCLNFKGKDEDEICDFVSLAYQLGVACRGSSKPAKISPTESVNLGF